MALPNDSVAITPGTGATIATHLVSGKEYQAVVLADEDGHIQNSTPVYKLIVVGSAVGSNKVHLDMFNATGSGGTLRILSALCFVDNDSAVSGTVGVEMWLTRTTSVGTGGTAATTESTSLTAPALNKIDTNYANLSANITARAAPAGGAAAGAVLGQRFIFTEETSAPAGIAGIQGAQFICTPARPIYVRENSGVRFVQGAVASVGTLTFEIKFEVI